MTQAVDTPDFSRGTEGLLPAIAQEENTGRVLMLAWMNEQAWKDTIGSGFATYWSRSRSQLWRKGETSGHRQAVSEIRIDCDADTILLTVRQTGAACHDGFESCFYRKWSEEQQFRVADARLVDPAEVYKKT